MFTQSTISLLTPKHKETNRDQKTTNKYHGRNVLETALRNYFLTKKRKPPFGALCELREGIPKNKKYPYCMKLLIISQAFSYNFFLHMIQALCFSGFSFFWNKKDEKCSQSFTLQSCL